MCTRCTPGAAGGRLTYMQARALGPAFDRYVGHGLPYFSRKQPRTPHAPAECNLTTARPRYYGDDSTLLSLCVCVCVCLCRCMLTPNQTWSGSCRSTRSVYVCVHVCVYIFLWPLLIPPARFRNDLLTVGVASGSIGTTDWTHLGCPGSWLDGVKGLCTRYVCL